MKKAASSSHPVETVGFKDVQAAVIASTQIVQWGDGSCCSGQGGGHHLQGVSYRSVWTDTICAGWGLGSHSAEWGSGSLQQAAADAVGRKLHSTAVLKKPPFPPGEQGHNMFVCVCLQQVVQQSSLEAHQSPRTSRQWWH